MLQWQDQLGTLADANRDQVKRAMARSISATLTDLKVAYSKFDASEGSSNRYTIESQTARYRELTKAAEGLLGPATMKSVQKIYETDLSDAYSLGTSASRDLSKVVDGAETSASAKISKMPIAAQAAAGQSLMQFWSKEKAALTSKVTEATLSALQRGKGWAAAQKDIAQALRSDGQTILRGRDELSVTARNGIVMNLEQRADLIAKTELANAYIQGQMAQYKKNGYTHGRWSATGERSCPFCVSREGNIYTLDELEGAIPAHPRCRCTVAPVLEENVKNVQNATDQQAAAALNLDDAGWTAIRQQRFSEFQKFTGKPMNDPAKYINTPTSRQKFFNPQAKGTKPAWMPSGKAIPDLNSVQAAAGRAAEQAKKVGSQELTAEEKIVNDVMNDKRFKSDAQRTREMRARLAEAGLSKDLDFVKVAADARAKTQGKGTAKDLEAQKAEAKKAEDLKKADAKKAQEAEAKKAEAEKARAKKAESNAAIEKLKQEMAAKRGELKVIDAELNPILKRNNQLKAEREALQKERTLRNDLNKELRLAKEAAEPASDRKRKAFMDKFSATSELKALQEKLANVKPGAKGAKFNLDKYDGTIAAMNHDMATLKLIGEDVLRRAGVTMQEVKTPVSGAADPNAVAEIEKRVSTAKAYIDRYKKNGAISRKNIKTLDANAELAMERAKRALDRGDIDQAAYTERVKTIKKNTAESKAKEQAYLDTEIPKKIKEWEDARSKAQVELEAAQKTTSGGSAQKVIDELVSSSPLTRKQAEALVKEAASTAARKKDFTQGRTRNLKPVPKDQGLDAMVDAVHMYGTRSSMDRYGLASERAHAHNRMSNQKDGNYKYGSDGYVNSGAGGRDFRGTQFHELGHHLEMQNSDFYRGSREFMKARAEAAGETIGSPRWLGGPGRPNYGRDEVGYTNAKSYDPYVMKEYDSTRLNQWGGQLNPSEVTGWQKGTNYTSVHQKASLATEVISMGVEKLATASSLQRLAEVDSEHLLFSLGVVKVQQARAKVGMERLRGDAAEATPRSKVAEVPEGSTGTVDPEKVKKSIKRDIDELETKVKKLEKDFKTASDTEIEMTSKASKIFDEISRMRQLEEIVALQEGIEDQSMALWNQKSPLEKSKRQAEIDIDKLQQQIKELESSNR